MEEEYRKLLECNRSKFCNAVTAERLLSPLAVSHVLTTEGLQSIQNEAPNKRVEKLLDALLRLDYNAFKKFCVVLETTYPYMLNCMFLGVEPPASAITRLEKDNQKKVLEKDFEGNNSTRYIQCGPRRINVGRSTSMTGHDFCRDRYSLLKNELKSVKWDLEQVKSELQRTEKERDTACHELAELSGQKHAENIENNTSIDSIDDSSDYEKLKHEYVNVLTELQILRQQNSDFNEKHSIASQEADYFRRQHKAVLNKCDMLVREAQGLHRKLEESIRGQEKIKQDYEEIVLLREREKFEMKERNVDLLMDRQESGSGDEDFAVEKCESLQKDYSQLQDTHRQLRSEYNHVFNHLQSMEVDSSSLKEQMNSLNKERDNLIAELNDSKQRNETIAKNVDKVSRDRDNVVKALHQAKQERDTALKDCDKIMNLQIKTARQLAKVNDERNAAVNEYRLVMSERDNVHRETEKIQDRFHSLQEAKQYLMDEKEKLHNQNSTLQDEVNLLSSENDKLLGEIYVLQKKCSSLQLEYKNMIMQRDKAADDSEMLKQERDAARRERSEAIIHRDKILKECFKVKQKQDLVLKGEAKEIDSLRKQFQILCKELTAAHQDADVAKQRCEWALLERGKAIGEQKRLWHTQELLQEDYNRLLSDVNEMLHESDQIRSQHNENVMELIDLKHRIQSILSSKGSETELLSSRDSAIDTDSMEWETESVVIEKSNNDLGIIIGGGSDTPLLPNDPSIVVTDITKGSIADGKLKVNDCLLKVNDLDLTNVEHKIAVQAITKSSVINLTVRRRRSSSVKSISHAIRLTLSDGNELGIEVDDAKFIRFISPGSLAAQHPTLSVGDKILAINGVSVENLSQEETEKLLSTSSVSLAFQKPKATTPTHPLHSLLEEVKNKINSESDIYQHAHSHRKKLLTMDNCSDMYEQHSQRQKGLYSGLSLPSVEEHTSSPDSGSVTEPSMNSSPSLQPFYDERREKSKGTQTDSSEPSIDGEIHGDSHSLPVSAEFNSPASDYSLVTAFTSHSLQRMVVNDHSTTTTTSHSQQRPCFNEHNHHAETHHSHSLQRPLSEHSPPVTSYSSQYSTEEKPLPPPRSCSFMTSLMPTTKSSQHYVTEGQLMSVSMGMHPSVIEDYTNDHNYGSQPSRGMRPQSAPTSRQQNLPYTSHLDPLALTIPKVHPASPPASVAVLKSRTVPFYTATSYVIPRYNTTPPETQQCLPIHCTNSISGSKRKGSRGTNEHSCTIQHSRQGSTHSADERQRSLDSSHGTKSSRRLGNRMSLPGYQFSSQPCFPLSMSNSSVESSSSISSGQVTPLRTAPSTPIVPVMEGEILAFSFSNPAPHSTTSDTRDAEPRLVHIEKKDTLGISIAPGNNGGIFVCSVGAGSVAEKAGLKYGDQLLEYNGVNLRCANYEQAAKILKESGNSVTILAQFNPQRALEGDFDIGNSSVSESSTTCSTPVNRRKVKRDDSTITPPLPKDEKVVPLSDVESPGDIRIVYLNHTSTNLGFHIIGGNATGIFVAEVDPSSEVAKLLNVGDKILEYDGCDMLSCTAEQALLEFCKSTRPVKALVQYNPSKFNAIKDQPGDSFHVRCLYDHSTSHSKEELSFKKGDILKITDTIYQGYIGCWKACRVSPDDAQRRDNGIVPSRMKAEQEILLHRSLAAAHGDDHRLSGRRSLFRRSKKSSHSLTISHSREGSDSAASITSASELGLVSYQTVERLDSHIARPVVIFGPLAEVMCEKLACDFPYNFVYCKPELVNLSREKVDKCIAEGTFVDYTWKGGHLACTLLSSLQKNTDKHPLIVVNPEAIERLQALQVYPIVIFVKFKSYKSIKELKDTKYIQDRIASKDAKEMFESAQRLEKEFKPIFNGVVHGHSLASICSAIQECVTDQQKKTIWVPLTSI